MTTHRNIQDGTGRYGVVREPNGAFSVVDKTKEYGQPERYPVRGVSRARAWREAALLERTK